MRAKTDTASTAKSHSNERYLVEIPSQGRSLHLVRSALRSARPQHDLRQVCNSIKRIPLARVRSLSRLDGFCVTQITSQVTTSQWFARCMDAAFPVGV